MSVAPDRAAAIWDTAAMDRRRRAGDRQGLHAQQPVHLRGLKYVIVVDNQI